MSVTNIISAFETRMEAVTGYKKLSYVYDLSKNNWNMVRDAYGVRPLDATETESVTKRLTYTHSFEVVLTKGYVDSKVSDEALRVAAAELQDLIHSMFVDFERTRLGIPGTVLNVVNLSINSPEVYDAEKVVALTATVNVLYRYEV